mgnify:CR=1 FL=1
MKQYLKEKISDNQLLEQYRFVKLETNESCLLGAIDQIEVFANKIYILDSYQTKSIYVFDKEGKYLNRLEGNRRGPGEFNAFMFCHRSYRQRPDS